MCTIAGATSATGALLRLTRAARGGRRDTTNDIEMTRCDEDSVPAVLMHDA